MTRSTHRPWPQAVMALMALALLAGATAASAEIYRCGPDGRSFSDRPCRDGTELATTSGPSADAAREAQAVAARERDALQRLSHERRQRWRAAGRQGAAGIATRPSPPAESVLKDKKGPPAFRAGVPRPAV